MLLIDASSYQGRPNWVSVAKARYVGAWLKATEGANTNDPDFAANRVAARKAGLHVGAYHFAHPELHTPEQEAAHFARVVGKIRPGELRPVLDYEVPDKLTPSQTDRWIRTFNQEVKKRTGVLPVFYSYPGLISSLGLKKPVGDGLWLASYGANDAREHAYVAPWPWKHVVAHQFTSVGSVPGIKGHVDITSAKSLTPLLAHPVRSQVTRPLLARRRGAGRPVAV